MAANPHDSDIRASKRSQAAGRENALSLSVSAGAYGSAAEARAALDIFVKRADLPYPTTIWRVGEAGLYIVWSLSQAISRSEWRRMTAQLRHACVACGFRADKRAKLPANVVIVVGLQPAPPTEDELIHPSSRRAA